MEAIVVLGLLVLLAVTAACFGYDSRAEMRSKEDEQAALGVTWERGS